MRDKNILMVDLVGQYEKIKAEINQNIIKSLLESKFINGPIVKEFSLNLSKFLNVKHVIPCANGTDALQIAYMALGLKSGDEIICPSWTYISTAEAAAILGVKPVFCDVDSKTFNVTSEFIEPLITKNTKAIVVVHLYGHSCDMEAILGLAKKHNLKVIEDNAHEMLVGEKFGIASSKVVIEEFLDGIELSCFVLTDGVNYKVLPTAIKKHIFR